MLSPWPAPVATNEPSPTRNPLIMPTIYVHEDFAWEYKRVVRNLRTEDVPSEAELDLLGQDGWELAGAFTDSPMLYLYFKRPKG